jgi:hypothetical protein
MSPSKEIIHRLIHDGMEPSDAAILLARAALEANLSTIELPRNSNAERQKRYRDRNALHNGSVTERNESITDRNADDRNETVTNRNETVTRYVPPLSSFNNIDKKERERGIQRNALPDDWKPSLEAIDLARARRINVMLVASKFRDTIKAEGKTYDDYDAAFLRWVRTERLPPEGESETYYEPQRNYTPTAREFELAAANFAKNNSFWGKAMGPEPGMSGCKCPPEILIKFGIDPKTGLKTQAA